VALGDGSGTDSSFGRLGEEAKPAARSGGVHRRSEGRAPAGAWEEAVLFGRPRSVEAERKGEERSWRTPLPPRTSLRTGAAPRPERRSALAKDIPGPTPTA
jgi:hypothetical protein